ncbi:MAG: hypothetical protein QOI22_1115 [Verrucomicrobiota bacterium]
MAAPSITVPPVGSNFRSGFYAGLFLTVVLGIYLARLWQPDRQVQLHSAHLISQIEKRNWSAVADFLGADYRDQWGDDRRLVLERLREVFGAPGSVNITANNEVIRSEGGDGWWKAKITIKAGGPLGADIEERINSLSTPFELEWHRLSSSPWDWKLINVTNPALEIPRRID